MITIADMSPPPTTMIGPRTKVVVSNHGNEYSVYFQGRLVAEFRVVGPQPDRGRFHTAAALLSPGIDVDMEKNPEWQIVKKEFADCGLFSGPAATYAFAKRFAISLEKNNGDWTLFLRLQINALEKTQMAWADRTAQKERT